jgi:hypothetical protein
VTALPVVEEIAAAIRRGVEPYDIVYVHTSNPAGQWPSSDCSTAPASDGSVDTTCGSSLTTEPSRDGAMRQHGPRWS